MIHDKLKRVWQLILPNGRVLGPYSTDQILRLIREGRISGQERVKKFQKGSWKPIAQEPLFYEAMIERLPLVGVSETQIEKSNQDKNEQTVIKPLDKKNSQEQGRVSKSDPEVAQSLQFDGGNGLVSSKAMNTSNLKKTVEAVDQPLSVTIDISTKEQKPDQNKFSSKINRYKLAPIILIGFSVMVLIIYLPWFFGSSRKTGFFELKHINLNEKTRTLSRKEIDHLYNRALKNFFYDLPEYYDRVQSDLVTILRDQPDLHYPLALLCLTIRELWPYTSQGQKELEVIRQVTHRARAADPVGEIGANCEVSRHIVSNQWDAARGAMEYFLNQSTSASSWFLVTMKAEALAKLQDYSTAVVYLDSVLNQVPNWPKPWFLKGQYLLSSGRVEESYQVFQSVVEKFPFHKPSWLTKGLIEIRNLKMIDKGQESILKGLELPYTSLKQLELQSKILLAKTYLDVGNSAKALVFARQAFEISPQDESVRSLLLRLGEKVEKKSRGSADELISSGDQYTAVGDCLSAQAEYKTAFELDPSKGLAALKAAKCLWEIAQPLDAIEWLEKAIRADPHLIDARVLLADYLSSRYEFERASRVLAEAKSVKVNDADVFKGLGIVEFRKKNYKVALTHFEKSLKLAPNSPEVLSYLARALYFLGEFDKAIRVCGQLLDIDPSHGEGISTYAQILAAMEGSQRGIDYLNNQLEKFAFSLTIRLALADLMLSAQRYEEAEKIYRQVIEFNPRNQKAWLGLGKTQYFLLKYSEANKSYIEAAIIDPFDPEPLFLIGVLQTELGQYDRALSHFEKAALVNPNYPNLYYKAGLAALGKGDLKLAMEYAKKERKKNPNLVSSYILAAEILDRNQEYMECAKEYQQASRIDPKRSDIYTKMARCYRLAGELDVAEMMLSLAVSIESGNPEIYREQGAIFEAKGDFPAARIAYEKYLLLSPNANDRKQIEDAFRRVGGVWSD